MSSQREEIEKLAALALAPLVEIAWADGSVTAGERQGVMEAAQRLGIGQHSDFCRTTLMRWLHEAPPTEALEKWRSLLAPTLKAGETRAARRGEGRIMDEARRIAKMDDRTYLEDGVVDARAGITAEEQRVLDDLDRALASIAERSSD